MANQNLNDRCRSVPLTWPTNSTMVVTGFINAKPIFPYLSMDINHMEEDNSKEMMNLFLLYSMKITVHDYHNISTEIFITNKYHHPIGVVSTLRISLPFIDPYSVFCLPMYLSSIPKRTTMAESKGFRLSAPDFATVARRARQKYHLMPLFHNQSWSI